MGGYSRDAMLPPQPPPSRPVAVASLLRRHVFNGWRGVLLSLVALLVVWQVVPPMVRFLFVDATWTGGREACLEKGAAAGACWPFIAAKLDQLIYGFYPAAERWRVNVVFALGAALLAPLLAPGLPAKRLNAVLFLLVFPLVSIVLLVGGRLGLAPVETNLFGGLLVTLIVSITGMVVALPLGILLALARRSRLPLVSLLAVGFIEFWRGVPLVTVLFFATYMLPLFMPSSWSVDAFVRALVGVAIFASAYMAEVVRGGLQALPPGQVEGAKALGLGYWRTMRLVVLPQALRLVIPGIANTFIGLFKDTTLVMTVAIFDFLGQLRAALADPAWAGPATLFTGFAFCGFVYFLICFAMSRYSLYVERRLALGGRGR